jgi:dienelactone hydrolase
MKNVLLFCIALFSSPVSSQKTMIRMVDHLESEATLLLTQVTRSDISFRLNHLTIRGWLYMPAVPKEKNPAIIISMGFSGIKEQTYPWFALKFANAGYTVLLYDQPNFGNSDGEPRQEADPWQQIAAIRNAITFLGTVQEVDSERIGLWGGSYGGGHALVVAAMDRRVKCVVAMTPALGTGGNANDMMVSYHTRLQSYFQSDRKNRFAGGSPVMIPVVSDNPEELCAVFGPDPFQFVQDITPIAPSYINQVTLRSLEMLLEYEPGVYISRISPTPLLLIMAKEDKHVKNDLMENLFTKAAEPKQLIKLEGHHFSVYIERFKESSSHALEWFKIHLK